MRRQLEQRQGERVYVFTTLGQVYVGVLTEIVDEVVYMMGPDARTPVLINLGDISGVRGYDQDDDGVLR
ncbi:MAG TPA: hypothetical protein VEY30_00625 [Myxococcaceae bacterium]|nr:hypothetical protein [Myxococcaceae bacterium]